MYLKCNFFSFCIFHLKLNIYFLYIGTLNSLIIISSIILLKCNIFHCGLDTNKYLNPHMLSPSYKRTTANSRSVGSSNAVVSANWHYECFVVGFYDVFIFKWAMSFF